MKLVSVNKIEKNVVELEIAVDAMELAPALEGAYRKNAPKIHLPGFRPGKAPRAMVEKQYGALFLDEAINSLYPAVYGDALAKADITPVDQADVQVKDASKDGFTLIATVTVRPEVSVKDYKGVSGTKATATVDAAEVESTLTRLQERGSRLVTIEDRAAEEGDTANFDFEGFVNDVAFEGGKAEGFDLVLGSGQFIPGFEEQIVGKKIGEAFDVTVTFPESYHAEDLAGKEAIFKCKLHGLKVKELPLLDDEFAKDVSEFDTLAELKADIEKNLLERAQQKCDEEFENQLVSAVLENTEMDLPQVMVEKRIDEMLQDFAYRLQSQGMDLDTYVKYTGESIENMRRTFEAQADRHVRIRLALEEIAKLENLTANGEEVEAECERLAGLYNVDIAQIKTAVDVIDVMNDIKVNKAIDLIKEHATIIEASGEENSTEEKPKKKTTRKTTKKTDKEETPAE